MKRLTYRYKIMLGFVALFAVFSIGVIVFEQTRERDFKTEMLKNRLDTYADMTHAALAENPQRQGVLDSMLLLFPKNIRLTLVDQQGQVLFDNAIKETSHLENHAGRPEIIQAQKKGNGTHIRVSTSNNLEYLYYAKQFPHYYIRVALPYDIEVRHSLQADNLFLYYILALFVAMLFLIHYVSGRIGKSIKQLRDFVVHSDEEIISEYNFPKDELGEIGMKITENYHQLKESKKVIATEHEKLLQHVYTSEEGICFFSAEKKVEFYNGLFIQYLNMLTDEPNSDPSVIFSDTTFSEINTFLSEKTSNYFETQIRKHGKDFSLRVNRFDDHKFEVILNDITKQEKTRRLKQEMTGNIAHELRTPVTSIRGYLETIMEQPLDDEKKRYFVTQAYNQTMVLSELIQDMGLITKIEEAPQSFKMETVNISQLLERLKHDLSIPLQEKGIDMQWNIPEQLQVKGNPNLLYSIFRNLTDNAIRYAGEHVKIRVSQYNEDKDFYYFSFSDNGVGILDESHLPRLFERFYRINEGRTRDTGGSGLGLSIVKNAIAFHKGTIVVKNKAEGGLEFLFKLGKCK